MGAVFGNLRWSRCGASREARGLYKAQLCASCHAMRGFSGRATSLLANWDQTLLVLVLTGRREQATGSRSGPATGSRAETAMESLACTAVPWRRVDVQPLPGPLATFVAAGNLGLIDAKLRDDIDDGGRWYARPLRWLLRRKVRRATGALGALGFPVELFTGLPARQAAVERDASAGLDGWARPSAELLGEVFAHGGRHAGADPATRALLRRFGQALARAVYAFDALEDRDEDRRRGRFNAVTRLADRVGAAAAAAAAQRFVELAVVEAQGLSLHLVDEARRPIVHDVLAGVALRARRLAASGDGRTGSAALRPAEAGDCDCSCACDGCGDGCCSDGGGCDACDCTVLYCPCDPCCDPCFSSSKRDERRERRARRRGR